MISKLGVFFHKSLSANLSEAGKRQEEKVKFNAKRQKHILLASFSSSLYYLYLRLLFYNIKNHHYAIPPK